MIKPIPTPNRRHADEFTHTAHILIMGHMFRVTRVAAMVYLGLSFEVWLIVFIVTRIEMVAET